MKRGEIWTAADKLDYAGKPRPVLIIQDNAFAEMDSITLCPITSADIPFPSRIFVAPSSGNGLLKPSNIMADKLMTMPRGKLGKKIGVLERNYMADLERTIMIFLGLAGNIDD